MDIVERMQRVLNRATQDMDDRDEMMQEAIEEIKSLRAEKAARKPIRWMITETRDTGSKCWKVVEHEFQANEEAKSWRQLLTDVAVEPLYPAVAQARDQANTTEDRELVRDAVSLFQQRNKIQ